MGQKVSKILIVDDSGFFRLLVRTHLKNLGYENVTESVDAESALKLLQKEKFDLIISDYNMSGLNGVEFFNRLRSDSATREVPFFLISSEGRKDQIEDLKKSGIEDYLLIFMDPDGVEQWLDERLKKLEAGGEQED